MSDRANFRTGGRDYSRSPPSNEYHRGADARVKDYRRDGDYGRDYDDRYEDDHYSNERHVDRDYAHSRRETEARGRGSYSHYHGLDDERMYDDDYNGQDRHYAASYDDHEASDGRSRGWSRGRNHQQSRGRSRSYSPSRDAGRPTDTVILEGLPFSVSTTELRGLILENTIARDFPSIDVRIPSTRGNRRAFVQFPEVDYAVAFVKEHFPKIRLVLQHSTDDAPDGKVNSYIHYARSKDEAESRPVNNTNWNCPSCDFANYSTRSKCKICGESQSASLEWQQSLTGAADAADLPSQILVVYPLAPFVNEEMLATDLKRLELDKPDKSKETLNGTAKLKSTAPSGNPTGIGARHASLHRVFLMRDSNTDESLKFGFAEFWTIDDATAAMAKFRMARSFTVAACATAVYNTHMGVFVPLHQEWTQDTDYLSFHPLFNPSLRVRYRDHRAYPSQRVVTEHPPGYTKGKSTGDADAEAKKLKKRKAESAVDGTAAKRSMPMSGQISLWQKKHNEINVEGRAQGEPAGPPKKGITGTTQGPIKISLGISSLPASNEGTSVTAASPPNPQAGAPPGESASEMIEGSSKPTEVSYVDRDRLMCLICMRKYKSVDEVNIHERSRNHKTAMENEEQVKAALPRLAARDKRLQKQSPAGDETNSEGLQYRDRAKERRTAYSQPQKPSGQPKKAKPDPPKAARAEDKPAAAPAAKPAQSKGAGMLAKMGWTSGAGLGAKGDGRTDVIETKAYQEGVGLGAEGGELGDAAELAQRNTKSSYADYLSSVQDKARQRYNKMD